MFYTFMPDFMNLPDGNVATRKLHEFFLSII